jgi:hypothetical protein
MKQVLFAILFFLITLLTSAQTKVGGKVVDEFGDPIAFANVVFKNSKEGVITNENGIFYFESDQDYSTLVISFVGFETQEIPLKKGLNSNLKIVLIQGTTLKEVVVYTGKTSKKNNPALRYSKKNLGKKAKKRTLHV